MIEIQPRIELRSKWEQLAIIVAGGASHSGAYAQVYPDSSTPDASASRLLRIHPEIRERIHQLRDQVAEKATDHLAGIHNHVHNALLENIEHAKSYGKPVTNRDGEVVSWQRNHSAVNQGLKILADIHGLSLKAKNQQERGINDPEVQLTPDQLLASVFRRYAESKGMKIDQLSRHALSRIANAAGARLPVGEDPETEAEILRSVSETEDVP